MVALLYCLHWKFFMVCYTRASKIKIWMPLTLKDFHVKRPSDAFQTVHEMIHPLWGSHDLQNENRSTDSQTLHNTNELTWAFQFTSRYPSIFQEYDYLIFLLLSNSPFEFFCLSYHPPYCRWIGAILTWQIIPSLSLLEFLNCCFNCKWAFQSCNCFCSHSLS